MPLNTQHQLEYPQKPIEILELEKTYGVEIIQRHDSISGFVDEWCAMLPEDEIFIRNQNGVYDSYFSPYQLSVLLEKRRRIIGSLWN